MKQTSHWAALYFVALMTFGNYVLFNLLVAILVEGFSNQVEYKTSPPPVFVLLSFSSLFLSSTQLIPLFHRCFSIYHFFKFSSESQAGYFPSLPLAAEEFQCFPRLFFVIHQKLAFQFRLRFLTLQIPARTKMIKCPPCPFNNKKNHENFCKFLPKYFLFFYFTLLIPTCFYEVCL